MRVGLKWLWRIARFIFMLVGMTYALVNWIPWPVSDEFDEEETSVKTIISPDGLYAVDIYYFIGGGAISPFCNNTVAVRKASETIKNFTQLEKYRVYSDVCNYTHSENGPVVVWSENRKVDILFFLDPTRFSGRKIYLRQVDDSQQVQMRFSGV